MTALDQRRFKLVLLTPVHIGSGDTLSRGVDILEDRGRDGKPQTFVVDVDSLLSLVTPAQADEITRRLSSQDRNLLPYLRSLANVKLERVCLHTLQRGFPARDLRLHIRRGDGNPIIPGSSLKGTLRTLVLVGITVNSAGKLNGVGGKALDAARKSFSNPKRKPKPQWAAQPLETVVFRSPVDMGGPNILEQAHGDLMRCLHTRDIAFSPKDLGISFLKVHSPSRNDPRNLKPFTLAVEVLKTGATAETELTIDRQLLQGQWAEKLNFAGRALTWEKLSQWSLEHALRLLKKEEERALKSNLSGLPEEFKKLQSRIQQAVEQKKAVALRTGWGIGWEGTTGGVADGSYRKELIKAFGERMTRHPPNLYDEKMPFPKSRKLVEAGGYGVMGWILLEPL
jgi:CRISPR type III-A-associated RAMP protein Csm5